MILSSELRALPASKTQDFVRSFVKIQLQNVSAYAAEGKAFQASWDYQTQLPSTPKNDEISGFQTPILKPRASLPGLPFKAVVEKQATCNGETSIEFESHSRQNIEPNITVAHPLAIYETKETKKRRPVKSVEDIGEEHRDRLAQRRAKKRAKRDITNPEEVPDALRGNSPDKKPASASKCRTDGKKKKTKLPAGMALLHNFSAANIGQKRLTLQPGGVFNKGKASVNTQVNKKKPMKQVSAINVFSELHFLNSSTKPSDSTVDAQPSHASGLNTESRSLPASRGPTSSCLSIGKPVQVIEASESELTSQVENETKLRNGDISDNVRLGREETKSEVWDIEKANGVLISDIASSASKKTPSTVVLNTQDAFWNGSMDPFESTKLVIPQESKEIIASSDSSSLCPSHSASQVVNNNTTFPVLDIIHTTSRFFPSSRLLQSPGSLKDSSSYVAVDGLNQAVKIVDFGHSEPSRHFPYSASSFSQEQVHRDAESIAFWDAARVSGVSACGTLDSLEKGLNSYEADNHLFNVPREHLSKIDRHLAVHYAEDGGDRYDGFAFFQSDEYFETEPTMVAEDEAVSHEMLEDEDNLESYLWEKEGYSNHRYGTSIAITDDAYLCHEEGFPAPDEIYDREWNNNEFVEEDDTSSRCFHQDYSSSCDDLVSYGEDENSLNRLQCETLSECSGVQSEAEPELATHLFSQGRALLFGFSVPQNNRVEDEVAKNMRGHWLPQRL